MLRVTLKGLLSHKIRFGLTSLAVVVGVAFVVGSMVLTDSIRTQFNSLLEEINEGVELTVRGEQQFEEQQFGGTSIPIPASLLDEVNATPGVAEAAGTVTGWPALLVGSDGEPVEPTGPPLGVNWIESETVSSLNILEGRPPGDGDEVALDESLADDGGVSVGDEVQIQTPRGPKTYALVGIFSFGENNALGGATLAAFTTAETQALFNLEDEFQTIDISLDEGADLAQVKGEIASFLPEGVEIVNTEEAVEEQQDQLGSIIDIFGNVLLGFAAVTLFVSAFLIVNTFTIVIGQRVRELALLRAVGATGTQVALSVLGEAVVIGILSALIGFGLGILTALGLNAILNAGGFGSGETELAITASPFLAALTVGVVVTVLSATIPAWRSTRIPPVAAMRDGFELHGLSIRTRATIGAAMAALGAVLMGWALFGGARGMQLVGGLASGAVLVFLGVAFMSPLFATPMARVVGAPFARLFRVTGRLARGNAARSPRRTASSASALMIGLALVSMAMVAGHSIKESFAKTLGSSITADWYVSGGVGGFMPFSPEAAAAMSELPELSAVTGGRFASMRVADKTRQVSAVDYAVINDLFELDIQEGQIGAGVTGVMLQGDPAEDLGVRVGDTVTATFQATGEVELPVVAIYEDSSVLGNWIIDLDTYGENFTEAVDFWVGAKTADGIDPAAARSAIEEALADYPELEVQDREEFQESQEGQLDQLLLIINVFLFLAIVIAFIGIMNTLALSVFERTRELGLLRAVGESRGQVWGMITMEAIIVAVFGALLGVAVGVVFGLAIATALPEDFVNTVAVPIGELVLVVMLAAALGVVAAIYPAWKASRLDVLEAITYE